VTEAEEQKLVTVLVTALPNTMVRITSDQQQHTMTVYRRMLGDLDYACSNAAVERLLATSRFMPTVAEIRDVAQSLTVGEQIPGGEAWGHVVKAIAAQGAYRVPGTDFVFRDPVTVQVVGALGWTNLCLSENQPADRARFIELYDKLSARDRRLQLSEGLPAMQRFRALQERSAGSLGEATGRALALALVGRNQTEEEP
jgi:hypothetical protein